MARYNEVDHAMVLDTISNGEFVFKNTYENDKQLKINVSAEEAPDEFFFVHIKLEPSSIKTNSPCNIM